ncbi:MAG: DUF4221 family protein [Bacteroidota bacterium]
MKKLFIKSSKLFLLIFILSCGSNEEKSARTLSDFLSQENLIPIEPKIDPYTKTMQYFEGNLYWHNENRSTISKINLEKRTIEEVLKYDYDGPKGLGSPSGFYFISKDTVIIPSSGPIVYIVPIEGEEFKKINLSELNKDLTHTISLTRNTKPMHKWNHNLILNQHFYYRFPSEITKESLKGFFPFIEYNYSDNTYKRIPFNFSFESFDEEVNDPTYKVTFNENILYTITSYSNILYRVDLKDYLIEEINLKTNLIPSFTNSYFSKEDKLGQSLDSNMDLYLSEPQNLGILVDPYRNLFYRMTWPGSGVPEDVSPMKFVITPSHFILSVYDENFELKYEFELPEYEYIPHQYFVSEKGLHLFGNHPDHPDSKEDQILIHTFDFSD